MARLIALLALLALTLAPGHAAAEDAFRTPSGNIGCLAFEIDGVAGVRCDLDRMSKESFRKPKDCDLDFGHAFGVDAKAARGEALCYGDTALAPDARVLAYGETWRWKGLTCVSSAAGMRCANARGAGFEISRGKQRVF